MCRTVVQEEQKALQNSTKQIHICRQGPFPSLTDDEPMPEFDSETWEFAPDEYSNSDTECFDVRRRLTPLHLSTTTV